MFLNIINVIFTWGGEISWFLDDKPAEWLIAKRKNYQNIPPGLIHITLQEGMVIKGI